MSCETCKFWLEVDCHADFIGKAVATWGICRRYPPRVFDGSGADTGYGFESDAPGGWPVTDGTDWCGEFVVADATSA
jgi:hypothetical protein